MTLTLKILKIVRTVFWAGLSLALAAGWAAGWAAGCSCDEKSSASHCSRTTDCNVGYLCIRGQCLLSGEGANCEDNDGDGYLGGANCETPTDCDDSDAERGGPERCGDNIDNDCDGNATELDALCGAQCNPNCFAPAYPTSIGGWPEATADNSSNVVVGSDGALTLGLLQNRDFFLWVANTVEGTVSKLNSKTGMEVARYPTVLPPPTPQDWPIWSNPCGVVGVNGNCPARTAVDQALNVYVANRSFTGWPAVPGAQGTVTKILADASKCVDKNGDSVIQTSSDLNGDGKIELTCATPASGCEFYSGTNGIAIDECIAWTTKVGPVQSGVPRAIAVGLGTGGADDFGTAVGDVWVGLHNSRQFIRLSPSGEIKATVNVDTLKPYGASVDPQGRIWFVGRYSDTVTPDSDVLGYIDPTHPTTPVFQRATPAMPTGCTGSIGPSGPYGLTTDADGIVYLTYRCDAANKYALTLASYDISKTESERWRVRTLQDAAGNVYRGFARGIAVDQESIWVTDSHIVALNSQGAATTDSPTNTRVFQLSRSAFNDPAISDFNTITNLFPTINCAGPVGIGLSLDEEKNVWAVCSASNKAARYNPSSGIWTTYDTGVGPYTYSDFMGFTLIANAESTGRYAFVAPGCPQGNAQWLGVLFHGAVLPAADSLSVRAKSALSESELNLANTTDWLGPWPVDPVAKEINLMASPGPVTDNRVLGLELSFRKSADGALPKVFSIETVIHCASN